MTVSTVVREEQAASDARLAFGVAAACATGLPTFVFLPFIAGEEWLPPGVDVLWMLAGVLVVVLGPLAAGLAGWTSLVTWWARGDVLATRVRRLHLLTLLLVATYAVGLAASWSAGVFVWFSE